MIRRISYWFLPILSGSVWLGMLLGMLIGWAVDTHKEHYVSMDADQSVPYISDIGASAKFKPMFIALCAVTTATLDLSFLSDRWLRHAGRLTPNGTRGEKTLAVLAILFAVAGTAGLILLSVFDVAHHKSLHDGFLLLFLGGYVLSAICICWEYQRLGIRNRHLRILRASFWIKLAFVLVEVVLAIVFASLTFTSNSNGGAVVEWIIAIIFAFYVYSFAIDLYPAVRTRHLRGRRLGEKGDGDVPGSAGGGGEHAGGDGAVAPAMAQDTAMTASDMEAANTGYRGYASEAAGAAPAQAAIPAGRYDTAYGESAARATRAPRPRATNGSSAFVEGSRGTSANGALSEPAETYQPGRAY